MFTNASVVRHGPVSVRTLRCFRNSHSMRAALVPGKSPEHLLGLLAKRRDQWDLLYLDGVPDRDGLPDRLAAEARRLGGAGIVTRRFHHLALPIEGDWETYYYSLRKKKRHHLERLGRRLETDVGPLRWSPARETQVVLALDQHLELEQRSWKASRGEVILRDSRLSAFYREVGTRFAMRDRLQLDMLYAGDAHIASVVSLEFAGTRLTLKTSYDESFARYSPGWLVFPYLLQDAFSRRMRIVDFYNNISGLSFWTKERIPLADVLVFSPTPRGRLLAVARRTRAILRRAAS